MSVRDRIKRMEQMAMQEKEAAPDERGRSPGGVSIASTTSASGSPQPLSKVRTSFVAIADKDGRLGLRQPSAESSSPGRQPSGDTDAAASSSSSLLLESNAQPSHVLSTSPDAIRTGRDRGPSVPGSLSCAVLQDAGPGSATEQHQPAAATGTTAPAGPVAGSTGTDAEPENTRTAGSGEGLTPSKPVLGSASASGPTQSGPLAASRPGSLAPSTSATAGTEAQPGKALADSPKITEASGSKSAASRSPSGRAGPTRERAGTTSERAGPASGRPEREGQGAKDSKTQHSRDQSQAPNEGSKNARHRAGDKERHSAAKESAGGAPQAVNGAERAKTTKPASAPSTHQKTAGKPQEAKGATTPAAEKKPTEKKAAPSNVSPPFLKPRPKSPTQPVKLPERLTTHTTASATRTKNGAPPSAHANRPPSRTALASSGKGLGRPSSVTGRQHASFGPPPKQSADHHVKEAKPVDESFLARMMRPTQAYANKVADKVQMPPNTPPHNTTTRRPASRAKTGPAKKVPKSTTTASAAASPETNKSETSSTVKPIAKKVEKPVAEEALSAAPKMENSAVEKEDMKQQESIKEPLNVAEKKPQPPNTTETKQETSNTAEKETTPKITEANQEAPQPAEQQEVDFSGPTEKEHGLFSTSQKVDNFSKQEKETIPNSTETSFGPADPSISHQKSAADKLADFMNGGSEKVDSSQSNGTTQHEEQEEW